ncbi:hypothetical protein RF099_01475, partial [Escherichia coli]|nr:hypothetical protein [Escherichia coli]MDQ9360412.1 hypothetical protein [Escherichia coli]
MSVLLTEPTQQANDKVFKTAHVAFSVVTGTGRYVTGLKQFRDANPEAVTKMLACGTRILGVKEFGCDNPDCQ